MTTSTTTGLTSTAVTSTSDVASSSAASPQEIVRPRVVRRRGPLVLVVVLLAALALGVAAVVWISAHRDAAPVAATPVADAPRAVGDAAHGGPGSWADAVRLAVPARADDRALVAHGGAGRIVTGVGTSAAAVVAVTSAG